MKTPMQELLQDIKDGGDAIYMIERFYIEKEKQQIVDAVSFGQNNHTVSITTDMDIMNDYYNEKFKL